MTPLPPRRQAREDAGEVMSPCTKVCKLDKARGTGARSRCRVMRLLVRFIPHSYSGAQSARGGPLYPYVFGRSISEATMRLNPRRAAATATAASAPSTISAAGPRMGSAASPPSAAPCPPDLTAQPRAEQFNHGSTMNEPMPFMAFVAFMIEPWYPSARTPRSHRRVALPLTPLPYQIHGENRCLFV